MDLILIKAFVMCSLVAYGNADTNCSFYLKDDTLTIPSDLEKGQSCTWTVDAASNDTASMAFHLSDMLIASWQSLVMYDGGLDGGKVLNVSGQEVMSQVAVVFQKKATIVYSVKQESTAFGKIVFNTKACSVDFTNSLALTVGSPVTAPATTTNPAQDIDCTYNIASSLPLDKRTVVSVLAFNMATGSSLQIASGDENRTYTGSDTVSQQPDFFNDLNNDSATVKFFIKRTAANGGPQNFSLAFQPFASICTSDLDLENGKATQVVFHYFPYTPGVNCACRMRVTASGDSTQAILISIHEFELSAQDRLTILAGASSIGTPLDQGRGSVPPGFMLLSPGKSFTATVALSTAAFQRQINATVEEVGVGGMFMGTGKLVAGNASASSSISEPMGEANVTTLQAFYQLVATDGMKVQLSVTTSLPTNATLTLYTGLQPFDAPLITLDSSADSKGLQTVVGGSEMLVVLDNFPVSENFTALFTSVPSGCDQLVTDPFSQLTYMSAGTTEDDCTWTIAPSGEGVTVLTFDSLYLGEGSSVKVFTDPSTPIANFEGPELTTPLPQVYVKEAMPARVSITRGKNQTSDLVILSYKVVQEACGGPLQAPHAVLATPNFPNQYPLNARCQWTNPQASPVLYVSFDQLDLAQNHSISVLEMVNSTETDTLASYSGKASTSEDLPNDLVVPAGNHTMIQFSSVARTTLLQGQGENAVGTGAQFDYWLLNCGGNLTSANGSFASPGYPKPSAAPTTCVWILQLPPLMQDDNGLANDSQSVQFKVTAVGKQVKNINKYLQIFDGPGRRYPLSTANPSNGTSGTVLSRYASLAVIYSLAEGVKDQVAFNLTFTSYVCNATNQCANGLCMHPDWRCNHKDDCGDGSDEKDCPWPTPTPAPTPAPAKQDYSGYVKTAWVPASLFIGIVLGIGLLAIIPRMVRRLRSRGNNYSRMDDDRPVVA